MFEIGALVGEFDLIGYQRYFCSYSVSVHPEAKNHSLLLSILICKAHGGPWIVLVVNWTSAHAWHEITL